MMGKMANETAHRLRKTMTRQEVKLWLHLRTMRKLGFHFRRQVPIKSYIVDFACYHPKLIVELDGSQHSAARLARRDATRDAQLAADGFSVVRVWNSDIDTNLDGVFTRILSELKGR